MTHVLVIPVEGQIAAKMAIKSPLTQYMTSDRAKADQFCERMNFALKRVVLAA